ncbi:MAG: SCO7613 C-terminal domain-containing membrane protein, partial [Streptosporangiaceae bacterium]
MNTAVSSPRTNGVHCPGCLSPTAPGSPRCRSCGIWLAGPQAAELRRIDAELASLDTARTQLIGRRAALLDELIRMAATPHEPAETRPLRGPLLADPPVRHPHVAGGRTRQHDAASGRHEISGRTAARLLLAAGAVLVAIAITIFTAADWSRIGPLGRCAILLAATIFVLAAPRLVTRRGLAATAESIAAIGLVLTLGDSFLIRRFAGLHPATLAVSAFCGAMAAGWAAYGIATRLRGPRLAAIGLAQFAAPLAFAGIAGMLGGQGTPMAGPIATGMFVSTAGDIVLARSVRRRGNRNLHSERAIASAAVATWTAGVLIAAAGLAFSMHWPASGSRLSLSDSGWLALSFAAAAVVAVRGPSSVPSLQAIARPAAVLSGALAAMSLAIPATSVLPPSWGLAVIGASGFCVSAASLAGWPRPQVAKPAGQTSSRRLDMAAGSATILATSTVVALPALLAALVPPNPLMHPWAGGASGSHPANDPLTGSHLPGATVLITLCALACMFARIQRAAVPARFRTPAGAIGIVAVALAAGSVPAAAWLTGWGALIALTMSAAVLLVADISPRDVQLGTIASACGGGIAVVAALWSLATQGQTLAELSALAAIFFFVALNANRVVSAAIGTAGVLTAITGLAWAVPLAAGWPATDAAFAALGVAVVAVAMATALRRARPVHSVILDLGSIPVVLLAAAVTVSQRDWFGLMGVMSAMVASGIAWFRTGPRCVIAIAAATFAALAALMTLGRPLSRALAAPVRILAHAWQGQDVIAASGLPAGLPLAVIVLAASLAALATSVGAWQGSGRASLDAIAVALPLVAAPAGLASLNGGLAYLAVVGVLLALTLALTAWAAFGQSLAPAGSALVSAALTVAWALAAPLPTLIVLGCLCIGYGACAWRTRMPIVRIAASSLSVLGAAAFAETVVFAAGLASWVAGFAALIVAASAQLFAALLARHTGRPLSADVSVEVTGWLGAAAGVGQCLARPGAASAAAASAGVISLGVALRADRRPALWAGVALCYIGWCIGIAANGVSVPEMYTLPAAVIAMVAGWKAFGHEPRPHSWLAFGPGLVLLLLPSLAMAWNGNGWLRPAAVGVASIVIAITGARTRRQAPLLLGPAVAVLEAARAMAPGVVRLMHAVPGWAPAALGGAVLLWTGATYEARLRNLRAIRHSLS